MRGRGIGSIVAGSAGVLVWTAAFVTGAPQQGQGTTAAARTEQSFRTQSDAVRVDVSVRQVRRPVKGLTPADFALLDNGVPQTIIDVSYETLPIDVTIALDVSESVSGALLDQLRRAVGDLGSRLQTDDRLKLVAFNHRVRRLVDLTTQHADAEAAFRGLAGSGSTALLDTLAVMLTSPVPADRRHLIIIFSDGQDTASISHAGILLDLAQRTTPTVSFVSPIYRELTSAAGPAADTAAVGPGQTAPSRPGFGRPSPVQQLSQSYAQLARETGGTMLATRLNDDLKSVFKEVLDDFRSSYVLRYTARGAGGPGFHPLTVTIRREGAFDVRARRGYVVD